MKGGGAGGGGGSSSMEKIMRMMARSADFNGTS